MWFGTLNPLSDKLRQKIRSQQYEKGYICTRNRQENVIITLIWIVQNALTREFDCPVFLLPIFLLSLHSDLSSASGFNTVSAINDVDK